MGENYSVFLMLCMIWYHLHNLKNLKNIHGGVLLFAKLQALACNFTISKTPPWVFFTFFTLYKWYQIMQSALFLTTTITYYLALTYQQGHFCRVPNNCPVITETRTGYRWHTCRGSIIELRALYQNWKSLENFYLTPNIPNKHTDRSVFRTLLNI